MAGRPRLADLFSGAGGAAMGYAQAGFEVVGFDIDPQPSYPFEFHQLDVTTLTPQDLLGFDAVHASPPCQLFTVYRNNHRQTFKPVLNHIPFARSLLTALAELTAASRTPTPWVIENVPGAPLDPDHTVRYCGTFFKSLTVRRHRLFESNPAFPLTAPPCDHGRLTERRFPGSSNRPNGRTVCNVGEFRVPLSTQLECMETPWMRTLHEVAEAIPPPYTEHVGRQLLNYLGYPASPPALPSPVG